MKLRLKPPSCLGGRCANVRHQPRTGGEPTGQEGIRKLWRPGARWDRSRCELVRTRARALFRANGRGERISPRSRTARLCVL